jgi:uncharacterized protein DUF4129
MTDAPIREDAGGPTVPPPAGPEDRTETARFLVPALILVIVVGVAAAGAGLLVPASSLNDTGLTVVRVVGVVVAVGGVLLLCGPWRSSARVGMDALPGVLALAAVVVGVLALVSLPTSPITLRSDDGESGGRLADPGRDTGTGSGLGDDSDGNYGGGGNGDLDDASDVWIDRYVVIGDEYLELLDLDGDGIVTLDELDVDGDGVITVVELDDATGKLVVDGKDLGDLDVDELDVDGDGIVDLDELDLDRDRVIVLEDLDRDGDGVVRVDDLDLDDDINIHLPDDDESDRDTDPSTGVGAPVDPQIEDEDEPDEDRDSEDDDPFGFLSALGPIVLAAALVGAVLAAVLWGRDLLPRWRRRPITVQLPPPDGPPVDADAAQAGLSASLAAMAAGDDPRSAIMNAYLQLLDSLAEAGGARRPEEAPHEHLHRVLGPLGIRPEPTHRLAELFVMARFSPHPVEEHHRDEAASLLHAALADLHAYMARMAAEAAAAGVPVEAGHAP